MGEVYTPVIRRGNSSVRGGDTALSAALACITSFRSRVLLASVGPICNAVLSRNAGESTPGDTGEATGGGRKGDETRGIEAEP